VVFEPKVQGIVQEFTVTKVTPEEGGSKTVTVAAEVELPDGRLAQKTIVLTMKDGVITGFLEMAAPPPAVPRS
jgi:hypothetical protein